MPCGRRLAPGRDAATADGIERGGRRDCGSRRSRARRAAGSVLRARRASGSGACTMGDGWQAAPRQVVVGAGYAAV